MQKVTIAGICGSLRKGSYPRQAVRIALQGAQEVGAQTRLIDLRDYELISCDGNEDESSYPAGVFRLRSDVKQAQGLIPEQVSIGEAWKMFDKSGSLKDPELEKRVKEVGRQVARFAFLHMSEKAVEFLRLWEGAPVSPGG